MRIPQTDKIAHFSVSAFLVFLIFALFGNINHEIMFTFIIGLVKEIDDVVRSAKLSWENVGDEVANILGILAGVGLINMIIGG